MPGYVTVSIPEDLANEMDEVVKKKTRGYSSRAEIVKDAVRRLLDSLKEGKENTRNI